VRQVENVGLERSTKQTTDIVNLIFDGWRDTLTAGGRIEIRGFGNLAMKSYQVYSGRNPR
jgi:nucleoid DNA-binding protein